LKINYTNGMLDCWLSNYSEKVDQYFSENFTNYGIMLCNV